MEKGIAPAHDIYAIGTQASGLSNILHVHGKQLHIASCTSRSREWEKGSG